MRILLLALWAAALAAGSSLTITSPAMLTTGTQYEAYSATLTAAGGTSPYTWSVVTASTPMTLPEGTTLNASTGAISGTPSGAGYYIVTFQVTDTASNTAQAQLTIPINGDQHLGACTYFPADNVWRQRIDGLPVNAQSAVWNSIYHNATLHPDFGTQYGIPFTLVEAGQALTTITIDPVNGYPSESDFGINTTGPAAEPIPADAPIEGTNTSTGDRHVLTIDTSACMLYEMYYALLPAWTADSSALFNLNSDALRPAGWTSADAAGLPITPGLVSYDEVASGEIAHALRMTMQNTQNSYIWPGRHKAGTSGTQKPPMGARIRLRNSASVNARIAALSTTDQVIARALQQYGAFIADNGSSGFFTGMPDARWSDDDLGNLKAQARVTLSLATSADASSGSQLTFASAKKVTAGMWVQCHSSCAGIGVAGLTIANPVVTAVKANVVTLSQPLMADVPAGTEIDFVAPNQACSAGPGFCLDDFDYVDESALQVDPDSGATQPVITQPALAAGTLGKPYSATIAYTGGLPPFTCAITSGALPAGLTLNPTTCAIGGTITSALGGSFVVTVTDSNARQAQAAFKISVNRHCCISPDPGDRDAAASAVE
ncbi:MAG: Ig domain-containing protein [Bryobacteraceae bacterium]